MKFIKCVFCGYDKICPSSSKCPECGDPIKKGTLLYYIKESIESIKILKKNIPLNLWEKIKMEIREL